MNTFGKRKNTNSEQITENSYRLTSHTSHQMKLCQSNTSPTVTHSPTRRLFHPFPKIECKNSALQKGGHERCRSLLSQKPRIGSKLSLANGTPFCSRSLHPSWIFTLVSSAQVDSHYHELKPMWQFLKYHHE